MRLGVPLLLALTLLPAASLATDPQACPSLVVGHACAGGWSDGRDCATDGDAVSRDAASVGAGPANVAASGEERCDLHGDRTVSRVDVGAGAGPDAVVLTWLGEERAGDEPFCAIVLSRFGAGEPESRLVPCPSALATPNPGWGRLLP